MAKVAVHALVFVPRRLCCGLQTGVIHRCARKCFLHLSQHFAILPTGTGKDAQESESLFEYGESEIVHYSNPQCVYYDEISTSHSTEMNLKEEQI